MRARKRSILEKTQEGDRLIKLGDQKVYIVTRVVADKGWVILKEENGEHQILTSKEGLEMWTKEKD